MESFEKIPTEKELKLIEIRNEVDKIRDQLGEPIDDGIKETVIMLKAFGLPTTQSCEGHADHGELTPWIEIYPKEPEIQDWQNNDVLRNRVIEESNGFRDKIMGLINEFYEQREVSEDTRLCLDKIAYGFRLKNLGTVMSSKPEKQFGQHEIDLYKKEMTDFTEFLREKYLSRPGK